MYTFFFIPVRNMLEKVKEGLVLPSTQGQEICTAAAPPWRFPLWGLSMRAIRKEPPWNFDVAGLIHAGETGFCRDAACAMAAAVAQAMKKDADMESVLEASTAWLHKKSAGEMISCIQETLDYAEAVGYVQFRKWFY